MTGVLEVLRSRIDGQWDDLLSFTVDTQTWLEYHIRGGTAPATQHRNTPYSVLSGVMDVDEANREREGQTRKTIVGKYFGLEGYTVEYALEPLDEAGRTIRDPSVVRVWEGSQLLLPMFSGQYTGPYHRTFGE